MLACSPIFPPRGAAILQWLCRIMEVFLHVGAHGTGLRAVQGYMRRSAPYFAMQRIGFWSPMERGGGAMESATCSGAAQAQYDCALGADASLQLQEARAIGMNSFIISDSDLLGTLPDCVETSQLYPQTFNRLNKVVANLDAPVTKVLLGIRSLELFWCTAVARGVMQGAAVPSRDALHAIAHGERGWRDVLCDIAKAAPNARIHVHLGETYAARPDRFLADYLDAETASEAPRAAKTAVPVLPELRRVLRLRGQSAAALPFGMGCWNPFTNEEHATLREKHVDDLTWLTAGAEGRATLTEDRHREREGQTPSPVADNKGRNHDIEERKMARPGER